MPPFNNPTPEQTFLAKNYDEKKAERDPRGAFRNPQDFAGGAAAGIVGTLGSSSFSLPNVERAMSEMETGMGGPSLNASIAGRPSTRTAAPAGRPAGLATLASTGPAGIAGSRSPVSPSPGGVSPNPGAAGQTQHEVLQNFFQSLLSTKDRAAGSARSSPVKPGQNGSMNGATEEGS